MPAWFPTTIRAYFELIQNRPESRFGGALTKLSFVSREFLLRLVDIFLFLPIRTMSEGRKKAEQILKLDPPFELVFHGMYFLYSNCTRRFRMLFFQPLLLLSNANGKHINSFFIQQLNFKGIFKC